MSVPEPAPGCRRVEGLTTDFTDGHGWDLESDAAAGEGRGTMLPLGVLWDCEEGAGLGAAWVCLEASCWRRFCLRCSSSCLALAISWLNSLLAMRWRVRSSAGLFSPEPAWMQANLRMR